MLARTLSRPARCALVGATIAVLAILSPDAVVAQASTQAAGGGGTCGYCITCEEDGEQGHNGMELEGGPASGTDHGCFGGISCLGHGSCSGASIESDEDRLYALVEQVADGSMEAALELAVSYPDRVETNLERMALQVSGCNASHIVAHIPLPASIIAAIDLHVGRTDVRVAAR